MVRASAATHLEVLDGDTAQGGQGAKSYCMFSRRDIASWLQFRDPSASTLEQPRGSSNLPPYLGLLTSHPPRGRPCFQASTFPFFLTLLHQTQYSIPNLTGFLGLLQWLVQQLHFPKHTDTNPRAQLDKLVGIAMLVAATVVFLYYTFWTLFMVKSPSPKLSSLEHVSLTPYQPSPSSTRTTPSRTSSPLASGPSAFPSSSFCSPPPSSAPSWASS